jgi:hypothetical protein
LAPTSAGKPPPIPPRSWRPRKKSALLATLEPGAYTVLVSGANGGTGNCLVEVYEVAN